MNIKELSPATLRLLAEKLGTNYNSLRQVVHGRRKLSALNAIAVEKMGAELELDLPREEHSAACASCEFARACRISSRLKAQAKALADARPTDAATEMEPLG